MESLSTNQVARVTKATLRSKLSFMKWYTEIPSGQDKAGEAPHTLQERRPRNNSDRQLAMLQTFPQKAWQQRESLSGREHAEASREVIDSEEAPKALLPSTQNLGPGPFTFTYYGEEKNTPLTKMEAEWEGPTRTLDF